MKTGNQTEEEVLNRLSAGLSEEEIQCVLAGALFNLDLHAFDSCISATGVETSMTSVNPLATAMAVR